MSDETEEPLRRLEQRLSQASDAAERLIAEAARGGASARVPPAGWQAPGPDQATSAGLPGAELDTLMHAIRALRELIPPEVMERIASAIREVLLALKALIDFYLERLGRRGPEPTEVQDIPIE